jgi:hypothetical protein
VDQQQQQHIRNKQMQSMAGAKTHPVAATSRKASSSYTDLTSSSTIYIRRLKRSVSINRITEKRVKKVRRSAAWHHNEILCIDSRQFFNAIIIYHRDLSLVISCRLAVRK